MVPKGSNLDISSMEACVSKSKHELTAFILVIVGTAPWPKGLEVSAHDGVSHVVLEPSQD
jgi:hypothetical protein